MFDLVYCPALELGLLEIDSTSHEPRDPLERVDEFLISFLVVLLEDENAVELFDRVDLIELLLELDEYDADDGGGTRRLKLELDRLELVLIMGVVFTLLINKGSEYLSAISILNADFFSIF